MKKVVLLLLCCLVLVSSSVSAEGFTVSSHGQLVTCCPSGSFPLGVTAYRFDVVGVSSDLQCVSQWIDVEDNFSHTFMLDFNETYSVGLLYRNNSGVVSFVSGRNVGTSPSSLEVEVSDWTRGEQMCFVRDFDNVLEKLPEDLRDDLSVNGGVYLGVVFVLVLVVLLVFGRPREPER